jgi:hypothetical protein
MQGLVQALDDLAQRQAAISCGALARQLKIPGPGSIAKLAAALEATMAEDAAQGRPLRAALCHARLAGDLPADGYFETARVLGRFDGSNRDQHVQSEPALLYKRQSGPSAC